MVIEGCETRTTDRIGAACKMSRHCSHSFEYRLLMLVLILCETMRRMAELRDGQERKQGKIEKFA